MDFLLTKLERRLGGLAIEHLAWLIVGGMAAAYVLGWLRPEFLAALQLDIGAVRHGQVWRLVTYLFIPRTTQAVWFFFDLYLLWLVGTQLEEEWGAFKLNAYYFLGMLGTTLAAWFTGASDGNLYLNHSLFLAFATVFPDYQMLILFVIPVRMKWLGALTGALMVYAAIVGGMATRASVGAALATYLLFFSGRLVELVRERRVTVRAAARRESMRPEPLPDSVRMGTRSCAICGMKEEDGADIRVCTCVKCGDKPRSLCLEHARNH